MIRVGVAGWSYADWEGCIHPKPKPRGYHPLDDFSTTFRCVEINASFYRPLDPSVVKGWIERTQGSPEFRFTVKLHRDFTHERERSFPTPRELERGLESFRASLGPLLGSERLGAVLLQFPLSFHPSAKTERYLSALLEGTADLKPVVELRHRAWFDRERLLAMERRGGSLAVIDLPVAADHPPPDFEGRGPLGYLRLHGRNSSAWFDPNSGRDAQYNYRYSREELEPLADRALRLASRSEQTYVVTNNHFAGSAVADAAVLMDLVGQAPSSLPARWSQAFPELAGIATLRGQGGLF